jgi:hypothetical protein
MSRYNVGDGPLHDHDGERAQARAEAVDALVEEWSHDEDKVWETLLCTLNLAAEIAYGPSLEYSDEHMGRLLRAIIIRELKERAEREIDA